MLIRCLLLVALFIPVIALSADRPTAVPGKAGRSVTIAPNGNFASTLTDDTVSIEARVALAMKARRRIVTYSIRTAWMIQCTLVNICNQYLKN